MLTGAVRAQGDADSFVKEVGRTCLLSMVDVESALATMLPTGSMMNGRSGSGEI